MWHLDLNPCSHPRSPHSSPPERKYRELNSKVLSAQVSSAVAVPVCCATSAFSQLNPESPLQLLLCFGFCVFVYWFSGNTGRCSGIPSVFVYRNHFWQCSDVIWDVRNKFWANCTKGKNTLPILPILSYLYYPTYTILLVTPPRIYV